MLMHGVFGIYSKWNQTHRLFLATGTLFEPHRIAKKLRNSLTLRVLQPALSSLVITSIALDLLLLFVGRSLLRN